MLILREIFALMSFVAGVAIITSLSLDTLSWSDFIIISTCFFLAYFIWPSKKRGHRKQSNLFLDILEIIVEFPVEFLLWIFRMLGRLAQGSSDGFDIDF